MATCIIICRDCRAIYYSIFIKKYIYEIKHETYVFNSVVSGKMLKLAAHCFGNDVGLLLLLQLFLIAFAPNVGHPNDDQCDQDDYADEQSKSEYFALW